MILQLLKLILHIIAVAFEERQKAIEKRQKFELDEINMTHIAIKAIHRFRETAPLEAIQAQDMENQLENEVKELSRRPSNEAAKYRNHSSS